MTSKLSPNRSSSNLREDSVSTLPKQTLIAPELLAPAGSLRNMRYAFAYGADAVPNRVRNRCWATGKPRGVYRDFGLCRNQLRQRAHNGELPGVVKSSW